MRWIAIVTLAAASATAYAADWKKIISYDDTTGSIDQETIQRVDAIRLFTTRLDYRPARRLEDGRRFDRIDLAMTIHCTHHTLTAAKATIMNGEHVIDVRYDSGTPQPIRPDSDNDALYKAVCAEQKPADSVQPAPATPATPAPAERPVPPDSPEPLPGDTPPQPQVPSPQP